MSESQYSSFFENYRKKVETSNNYGNTVNFIGVTKKDPKVYIALLQPSFFPIPFHRWHEVMDGGKKRDFICRKMLDKPCFICDHYKEDPKPRFIAQVLQLEKDGKSVSPVIEDIKTSSDNGKKVLAKYPNVKYSEDGDSYVLKDMYRIGFTNVGKTVDDSAAALIEEYEDITGLPLVLSRMGEGLETSYNLIPYREADINKDKLDASIMASSTIDDYVNIFASEKRYNKAFNLAMDDRKPEASKQEESTADHVESRDDNESADKPEFSDNHSSREDVSAAINSLWSKSE